MFCARGTYIGLLLTAVDCSLLGVEQTAQYIAFLAFIPASQISDYCAAWDNIRFECGADIIGPAVWVKRAIRCLMLSVVPLLYQLYGVLEMMLGVIACSMFWWLHRREQTKGIVLDRVIIDW